MDSPNSFCFIANYNCHLEVIGMLLSLSLHHPNSIVYGFVDNKTKIHIEKCVPKIKLDLRLVSNLEKYKNKNRVQLTSSGEWSQFQMEKANVIDYALKSSTDTLFLDSDIFILNKIYVDKNKDIGVSPHWTNKQITDEFGYYNGGVLWTKNKNIPKDWIEFTKKSRYFDQASIEDLVKKYSHYKFGEEANIGFWTVRFPLNSENTDKLLSYIKVKNNNIYYKDKPLQFIHAHIINYKINVKDPNNKATVQLINRVVEVLNKINRYKELLIMERMILSKYVLCIPKQPRQKLWYHTNDSFRELATLIEKNNPDFELIRKDINNCQLGKNIILYDRPTLLWKENEFTSKSLLLLGNGDINDEGKQLSKQFNIPIIPWSFWPRHPIKLESFLENMNRKKFHERTNESIYIGNIETDEQNQNRNNDWSKGITLFSLTNGTKHKFTQQQYLEHISNSKYGLCLRGYGKKCHREVELMAFGTVPLITPKVNITSYLDPPKENIHFIRVNNPSDVKKKISNITSEKWEEMSKKCSEWFQKNVHSKNFMQNTLEHILYG
jgi:hypothetical protein